MTNAQFETIRTALRFLGVVSPRSAAKVALNIFVTPQRIPRPPWEVKLAKTGEPIVFKNGLKALEWGQGRPVLLIHGWQGRGTQLGSFVEPLVKDGFRVIALDGPAHGDSPGSKTNAFFFSRMIREIGEELEASGTGLYAIVAHSFGAAATTLALADGLKLSRVVLVASPSDLKYVIDIFKSTMKMSGRTGRQFDRQLEKWAGRKLSEVTILGGAQKRGDVPALVVHAPEDAEVSYASAEAISQAWPGSKLLPLPGVGHRRILKAPALISAVENFLR